MTRMKTDANPHCRIGTVRYKDAPHIIEIIPAKRGAEFFADLRRNTEEVCEEFKNEEMAGYVVIAWNFRGDFFRAYQIHHESLIQHTLLPSFIAEIMRREIAKDVVARQSDDP